MDRVNQLVTDVEQILKEVEQSFSDFQKTSGLNCEVGCGKCCMSPTIEASVLEMIPMAYELYLKGDSINYESFDTNQKLCNQFHKSTADGAFGFCTRYATRPLVCRLFGAYYHRNKTGEFKINICPKIIRSTNSDEPISEYSSNLSAVTWRQKIDAIEPSLSQRFYPINEALKKAIDYVENYYWLKSLNSPDIQELEAIP